MERILAKAIAPGLQPQDMQRLTQEQKRDLLARLLAQLAHELRNPLSSLDIHVQLLEEEVATSSTDLTQRTAERFRIIHGELQRLDNIVMRFLQLAGPSALTTKPLSVNTVVSHTCELLRPQAQERGIELTIVLADGLPQIEADADQLTQAFINLIINALQAAPTGGHVRVHTVVTGAAALAVEVSDDGPGIPVEDQDKIFEPYFTTKLDGSGLGLWITQQIVLAHGGTLHVQSEPRRGATFVVALPVHSEHG